MLCNLFDEYKWSHWDQDCLPENTYWIELDGNMIAAGCGFINDGNMGQHGFYIVSKKAPISAQKKGLDLLIERVDKAFETAGLKYVINYTNSSAVMKRLKQLGFKEGPTKVSLSKGYNGKEPKFLLE